VSGLGQALEGLCCNAIILLFVQGLRQVRGCWVRTVTQTGATLCQRQSRKKIMNWAARLVGVGLTALAAFAAGYGLGGIYETAPTMAADNAPMALGLADSGGTVNLNRGERFAVSLEGNASTGYSWQIVEQPAFCDLVKDAVGSQGRDAGAADRVGTPSALNFVFQCSAAGQGTLLMEYRRAWETGKKADKTFRLTVHVV
jgi:inhibitor of cysteine peptidase